MSDRSSTETELEYIKRQETERLREKVQERQQELAEEDREAQKQLHWMHCPKCGSKLSEVQYRDVKIDKCFSCNGVYLDDGELETLTKVPGLLGAIHRVLS